METNPANTRILATSPTTSQSATANLRGANLYQANLEIANLQGAFADNETVWPDEFDPEAAGVIFE